MSSLERYAEIACNMRVDLAFLRDTVTRFASAPIAGEIEPLLKGEANAVFDVPLADGSHVIARQSFSALDQSPKFYDERTMIEAANRGGVPVATVLGVDDHVVPDGTFCVSVQTKLPGSPLFEALSAMSPEQVDRVMTDVRATILRIHRLPRQRLPLHAPDNVAGVTGWSEDAREAVRAGKLPGSVLDAVDAAVAEITDAGFSDDAVVHADVHPKHFFTDGKRVTGVIDWETAELGDPAYDYAHWRFWCPRIEPPYEDTYPDLMHPDVFKEYGPDFAQRVRWAELRAGISTVSWYVEQARRGQETERLQDAFYSSRYLERALARPVFGWA